MAAVNLGPENELWLGSRARTDQAIVVRQKEGMKRLDDYGSRRQSALSEHAAANSPLHADRDVSECVEMRLEYGVIDRFL